MLFETNVGSHMWGMEHKDSDVDLFQCYCMSKRLFLIGRSPYNTFINNNGVDIQKHEIYHVVTQLKKMNINYIWYLTSPIVLQTSKWHKKLIEVFEKNPAKGIMYSIRGMVVDNMRKYKNPTQKKINMWMRTIWFGIHYMAYKKVEYEPVRICTLDDVKNSLQCLIEQFKESTLPEYPDPKPYEDFLYELREALVNGTL